MVKRRADGTTTDITTPRIMWTSEMDERLVELWQMHQCLYNTSRKDYHNRTVQENSWAAIAEALCQTVFEVNSRATSLRTEYTQLLKSNPSGEMSLTPKQSWILKSLDFLNVHVSPCQTETSLEAFAKAQFEEGEPPSDSDGPDGTCCEASGTVLATLDTSTVAPIPATPQSDADREDQPEVMEMVPLEEVSAAIQEAPPWELDDEAFCQLVAEKLRGITDPVLRGMMRQEIMDILFEVLQDEHPVPA